MKLMHQTTHHYSVMVTYYSGGRGKGWDYLKLDDALIMYERINRTHGDGIANVQLCRRNMFGQVVNVIKSNGEDHNHKEGSTSEDGNR